MGKAAVVYAPNSDFATRPDAGPSGLGLASTHRARPPVSGVAACLRRVIAARSDISVLAYRPAYPAATAAATGTLRRLLKWLPAAGRGPGADGLRSGPAPAL